MVRFAELFSFYPVITEFSILGYFVVLVDDYLQKLPIPIQMFLGIESAKTPIFFQSYLLKVYFKNSIKLNTMIAEIPMITIKTQIGRPSSFFSSISLTSFLCMKY